MLHSMQLFVVGELVGMTGVSGVSGASCKWWCVSSGSQWRHVSGAASGASQCDSPAEGDLFVFQHPVDVSFEATLDDLTAIGMPRIEVEVRLLDAHGRSDLGGYAVLHVPSIPGVHDLACSVWRPRGSTFDRIASFFVGGAPQLKDSRLRYGHEQENDGLGTQLVRSVGRQRLSTSPGGTVHMRLSVCHKKGLAHSPEDGPGNAADN